MVTPRDTVDYIGGPGPSSDAVDIYDADAGQWSTSRLLQKGYNIHALVVGER